MQFFDRFCGLIRGNDFFSFFFQYFTTKEIFGCKPGRRTKDEENQRTVCYRFIGEITLGIGYGLMGGGNIAILHGTRAWADTGGSWSRKKRWREIPCTKSCDRTRDMPWNTIEPEVPQDDRIQKSGETAAGSKTDDEACDCDEHGGGCPDSGIFLRFRRGAGTEGNSGTAPRHHRVRGGSSRRFGASAGSHGGVRPEHL